jgi:CheY-like chemotaxis protein
MLNNPRKILVVDDDPEVLIALERELEGEGYDTVTVWSGQEALVLSQKNQFDLMLVDEHLSDLDASTLLDQLRHTQPGIPRLVMSTGKKPSQGLAEYCPDGPVCKWEHNEVKAKIRKVFAA